MYLNQEAYVFIILLCTALLLIDKSSSLFQIRVNSDDCAKHTERLCKTHIVEENKFVYYLTISKGAGEKSPVPLLVL